MNHVHVHPEKHDTVVFPDRRSSEGEIHEGFIWCWSHEDTEPIPDEWRRTEADLKRQILDHWKALRPVPGRIVTPPDAMEVLMVLYCLHTGYELPTRGDLYKLHVFIGLLTAKGRGFFVRADVPRETSSERTP